MVSINAPNRWETGASVSVEGNLALDDFDIRILDSCIVRCRDIVLRADVHISHRQQRQLGDRVIDMSEAVVVSLIGDILGQSRVSYARCSIRVRLSGRITLCSGDQRQPRLAWRRVELSRKGDASPLAFVFNYRLVRSKFD